MKVEQVLHMNSGMEEETSYAHNSLLQRKVLSRTQPITEEAIAGLISSWKFPIRSLAIADLGCASGPNSLLPVSAIVKAAERVSRELGRKSPEFQVFLNDLPGNDFNQVFKSLHNSSNSESLVFFNGVPGSFYGRLFAAESLHFIHSSYSLHWLSQVPEGLNQNRGNIFMAGNSPPSVLKAYTAQFRSDFSSFLRCRGQELVQGGRMVLTLLGRRSEDPSSRECCYFWELISIVLNQMASEGRIDQEKWDSFNIPVYMPSPTEVKDQVRENGCFVIDRLKVWESSWNAYDGEPNLPEALQDRGCNVAKGMRAVLEPLFVRQLGPPSGVVVEIFRRFGVVLSDRMAREKTNYINLTVSLTKL
ncbi:unnamed protein product [Linum tenue]|uniref:Uncharacterized protein n=1 Tax=Linum tenue TaxID=586396 RepID=A0AAV0LPU9_9ROSI|nr:unnamed protein product [Linum tenue]